jgi:chromate reductase, NAD(P)H dehydrogenase (quinone)
MTDKPSIQVLAICGSLRKGSFNRMAMNAAIARAPDGMTIREGAIGDIPLYNEDVREAGEPAAVAVLKRQVLEADALLFATPEYNYGMPGALKNAIDWVSRPPSSSPFDGKPVAMLGASAGVMATVRSQLQLRQTCLALNMLALNRPEVLIGQAAGKFAPDGSLKDEATGKFIGLLMQALYDWTLRLRGA